MTDTSGLHQSLAAMGFLELALAFIASLKLHRGDEPVKGSGHPDAIPAEATKSQARNKDDRRNNAGPGTQGGSEP